MTEDKKEWHFLYFMFAPTCCWNSLTISNTKGNRQKVASLSTKHHKQGSIFFTDNARTENESFKIKFKQNISKFASLIFGKDWQKE